MEKYRILVVDDDKEIADAIGIYLSQQGYHILKAYDGQEALDIFQREQVDLIIMDIMMPRLSGDLATMRIREKSVVPILMLSAKSEDNDKIVGLNIGADDYITKPFNPLELIARVQSNLRRYKRYSPADPAPKGDELILLGGAELSPRRKELKIDGQEVRLTPLEFKILHLLMSHPGRVFSIEEIYEKVWNEPAFSPDTVTVHIRRIREKIEINPKDPKYVKVVWGMGYKFENQ